MTEETAQSHSPDRPHSEEASAPAKRHKGAALRRTAASTVQPRYVSIRDWCVIAGIGHTKTYEWIAKGKLRALKLDGKTLVDLEHGLQVMADLPLAKATTGLGTAPKRPR